MGLVIGGLVTSAVVGSAVEMSAGGREGITGESKSYADISMTGDVGGER